MTTKLVSRPGGRSARVQAAVHDAVRELIERHGRAELTVPLIAERAGVTPSTIYRRWGDLQELLAHVALSRMKPDAEPADTGSLRGDLLAWAEQYNDEMSSEVGLSMMRDVVAATGHGDLPMPCQCSAYTASQIAIMVSRGVSRGEPVPQIDAVMDGVVAPIVYRALFGARSASSAEVHALVLACLQP